MPAKTIIASLFLVSLAVIAILGLRALPQRDAANTVAARDEVLVAATALPSGTLWRAKAVMWTPTAGTAEPGYIFRPTGPGGNHNSDLDRQARTEVFGAALRTGIGAGEPINRTAIVKPGDRDFLQSVLTP